LAGESFPRPNRLRKKVISRRITNFQEAVATFFLFILGKSVATASFPYQSVHRTGAIHSAAKCSVPGAQAAGDDCMHGDGGAFQLPPEVMGKNFPL
jgi:hypothetical protein